VKLKSDLGTAKPEDEVRAGIGSLLLALNGLSKILLGFTTLERVLLGEETQK